MSEESANIERLRTAKQLLNKMTQQVILYEAGKITLEDGLDVTLSAGDITTLKANFTANRNAAKAALDAITE